MNMFPTEEEKMDGMISEIQYLKERLEKSISLDKFREEIIEAYKLGHEDGENEMYNSDYAGSRMQEKHILGESGAVDKIMNKYL